MEQETLIEQTNETLPNLVVTTEEVLDVVIVVRGLQNYRDELGRSDSLVDRIHDKTIRAVNNLRKIIKFG
jgi:hypothetical protein